MPSGRTIQAEGVTPDITVHFAKVEYLDDPIMLKEKDLKKHLESELVKIDTNKTTPVKVKALDLNSTEEDNATINKKHVTEEVLNKDNQLKSALDILKALIITNKGNK